MSVEVRPFGVKCNIQCVYCYQQPQRDAENIPQRYDLVKIKTALESENTDFVLFGGEPLLMPVKDLEEMWAWGFAKFGRNGVQTNGTLITEQHIRLFRIFNVHVGISVDGPGALNDLRWSGSLEKTRRDTEKTCSNIERLCKEGIVPSIIVTLHRGNASEENLPALKDWFLHLDEIGIKSVRLHVLEIEHESIRTAYALTMAQNLKVFLRLAEFEEKEVKALRFTEFMDMRQLLQGQDNHTSCVWNACDPYTTRAVRGVEGNGQKSNCGRTYKDGVEFVKADRAGYERYLALYHTPREAGGCQGCRFFLVCKGQCPGTAIDNDWRNRTEHCSLWESLYEHYEGTLVAEGLVPLSKNPRLKEMEDAFLKSWTMGTNPMIESVIAALGPVPGDGNSNSLQVK